MACFRWSIGAVDEEWRKKVAQGRCPPQPLLRSRKTRSKPQKRGRKSFPLGKEFDFARIPGLLVGFGLAIFEGHAKFGVASISHDWERAAAVNIAICGLLAAHFWRNRVGESLRRLSQRTA